jgi:hypothetical protein
MQILHSNKNKSTIFYCDFFISRKNELRNPLPTDSEENLEKVRSPFLRNGPTFRNVLCVNQSHFHPSSLVLVLQIWRSTVLPPRSFLDSSLDLRTISVAAAILSTSSLHPSSIFETFCNWTRTSPTTSQTRKLILRNFRYRLAPRHLHLWYGLYQCVQKLRIAL